MIFVKPPHRKIEAPGGIITPIPDYCWGQFATNGRDNRNTGGPVLALTGGTARGENLHGIVSSSGSVGSGIDHMWIYTKLYYSQPLTGNPDQGDIAGFIYRKVAGTVVGLDLRLYRFRLWNYFDIRKILWDRQEFAETRQNYPLSSYNPGGPGHEYGAVIHEFVASTGLAKTFFSIDGSSWLDTVIETVPGISAFSGGYPLNFNGHEDDRQNTNPPDPELVECCVREGGAYSDAENLQILQNGMEAAFGL